MVVMSSCLCCGTNAAQARIVRGAFTAAPSAPVDEVMVVCMNPRCRGKQRFQCAMLFCDRAFPEIPKTVLFDHPWMNQMMPYYRQKVQPSEDVYVTNCIQCCLSATIPEGVQPSPLLKLQHPKPIPGITNNDNTSSPGCVANSLPPTDTTLNEHAVMNLSLVVDNDCKHDQLADDDGSTTSSSTTSSLQFPCVLKERDDDSLSSEDEDYYCNYGSDDEDDEDYICPEETHPNTPSHSPPPVVVPSNRKRKIDIAQKNLTSLPMQSPDSMQYLSGYATTSLKKPNYHNITKRYIKDQRKVKKNMGTILSHEFVGALVLPTHKLILCNYAHNENLYVDIHGMAKSTTDGTPTIPHLVLTEDNAIALEDSFRRSKTRPNYLTDESKWHRHQLEGVEMPEDSGKTRAWTVDHTTISQKEKVSNVTKKNARTSIPPEELMTYEVFSSTSTKQRKHADFILIDGDFCMEDKEEVRGLTKLLTMRMQSMLNPLISDADAASMYSNLRMISGRRGSEVTRTSGTAGYVTTQSHKDLLFVLHDNDGLLPNKAGACLIIPHKKYYYIMYSKHNPNEDEHPIGMTTYAPPKPGGSLLLNGNAVDAWPVLGEFAYMKMIAALTLNRFNEIRSEQDKSLLAVGPIANELENIEYARLLFNISGSYRALVTAFMSVNSMSLIAWPVGQHNDHFNKGGESLENKITFTLPLRANGDVGRGGSLFHNQFVFALLDWQWTERSARRFYVTHADEMGIGPAQPRNAQALLTAFFNSGDDAGGRYLNVYDNYMRTARRQRRAAQNRSQQRSHRRSQRSVGRGTGPVERRPIRSSRRTRRRTSRQTRAAASQGEFAGELC